MESDDVAGKVGAGMFMSAVREWEVKRWRTRQQVSLLRRRGRSQSDHDAHGTSETLLPCGATFDALSLEMSLC